MYSLHNPWFSKSNYFQLYLRLHSIRHTIYFKSVYDIIIGARGVNRKNIQKSK